MKNIVVYCGSKTGNNPVYATAAADLASVFARRDIALVYGGGTCGLMGVVSNTLIEHGGKVIGVITKQLNAVEAGNTNCAELLIVETMHERKRIMCARADAAIILPGAYGTLDELFEFVTWTLLGIHNKPCGILNVNGYYDHQLAHIDRLVTEGFMPAKDRDLIVVDNDPENLLDRMDAWIAARPHHEEYKRV